MLNQVQHDKNISYKTDSLLWKARHRLEEKALEEKNGGILFIGKHPMWKDVQADPRFKILMKKVGLSS